MEKQELLDLGLDEDTVKQVMVLHAKDIQVANAKTAAAEQGRDDLKTQLEERDSQLTKLKKAVGDNEDLQDQIKSLQDANKQATADYQEKLAKQSKEFKIDNALRDANAKNPKAVKALLELDQVSVDGENLVGLEDQLNSLKESDGYLFGSPQSGTKKKIIVPGNPGSGDNVAKSLNDMSLAEQSKLYREDPAKWKELADATK